ncbi:HAMP domain-containing histidine kinase [Paenibacillus barcinonensis]|uniref:histidine kinase n=1 Tax=Paenibacillus barcinonensis TaxID=198119 RepID=A0A2V4VMI6_PAEBA|nr:HAMP domain-containing sensor histidine kinase [Paenibacillus barcinonensis]PYE47371.1 signal transduction histidine kinase [Paenibacillus barcinonensis]QKS58258.1 HAMP domain-containing histidine kinase [Paenibacillus barcinonensis]
MKLKYWLMLAFLIVMLLPVAAGWALFSLYSYYENQRAVAEYVELSGRFAPIEKALDHPKLYQLHSPEHHPILPELASEQVSFNLYLPSGIRVYSSGGNTWSSGGYTVRSSELYRNLYNLQIRHRTFSLKKPVWNHGELAGIYEITMLRQDWLEGISNRTTWVVSGAALFFVLLYGTVLWLLSRKLFSPMRVLMDRMHAFARGEKQDGVRANIRNDEMGTLLQQFDAMQQTVRQTQAEVEKQQKEKEMIVASLSHDLKTPLMSISAYAEAISMDSRSERLERQGYRDVIARNVERMKQMIGELEMYTALGSSDSELAMVEVEGEEFFEMLLGSYEGLGERDHYNMLVSVRTKHLYRIHPESLMRLTDNLVHNALRYTPSEGRIGLAVIDSVEELPEWMNPILRAELDPYRTGATIMVVQNEGAAIPPEQLERIFEPYVQYHKQERHGFAGGSGLGLSIARRIALKHGGDMRMWSSEQYGTAAVCRLPEL